MEAGRGGLAAGFQRHRDRPCAAQPSLPDGLLPWSQITGLEDVSGVGTYRATFTPGREWTEGTGARLELGEVCDTFRIRVNGHALPPADQVTRVVDLGSRLRHGPNTIEVELATTLLNRLRVADAPVFGAAKRQAYELLGPVRVVCRTGPRPCTHEHQRRAEHAGRSGDQLPLHRPEAADGDVGERP
ncbi:hypothetical protein [Streptomyces sp. NPDC048411]|uniref:hypothetical protein n=1 Tax=Streptomyces sp. NPDC048411 TaxID=3157206 RepID=UPI003455E20B